MRNNRRDNPESWIIITISFDEEGRIHS